MKEAKWGVLPVSQELRAKFRALGLYKIRPAVVVCTEIPIEEALEMSSPGLRCKCHLLCVHQHQMQYFNRTGHHPFCEIHGEGKGKNESVE